MIDMTWPLPWWGLCLMAYAIGGIPFGLVWSSLIGGPDPRTMGSGSVGATNIWRSQGPWLAVLVYGCDMAKSAILVAISPRPYAFVIGAMCVIGHIFSPYLRLKGGKGIATASGVLMGINPGVWLVCVLVWASIVAVTGYVSLSCLLMSLGYWLFLVLTSSPLWDVIGMGVIVACVTWAHRSNIQRLLKGTEYSFKHRKKEGGAVK